MVNQIREEFSRQAKAMSQAAAFNETEILQRITAVLGCAPDEHLLEIACGPGILAEAVAPLVKELVCVDATPAMIILARERLAKTGVTNVKFVESFAEQLPFEDAQFDVIVTRLSLHHFADIPAVLAELRRVLRSQGRLVVADIVTSEDPEEARLHNALEQLRDPSHVRMFSAKELIQALQSAGFELKSKNDWMQPRAFEEWARIVSSPARTRPLLEIMRTLCRAGLDAGVRMREEGGEVLFDHKWILVAAEVGS
jgi:ubiquinone/menaquinone biosynthesis C-methylase UbiE